MIQEVQPNTSKHEIQLHQDLVHEVGIIQRHAKDIQHEQSKWFAKDINKVAELNTNSPQQWITIAKKVIRSVRRKIRQDKHRRFTKFYSLQINPEKYNRTIESLTPPTSHKKQPSILKFFQPNNINGTTQYNNNKNQQIDRPADTTTNYNDKQIDKITNCWYSIKKQKSVPIRNSYILLKNKTNKNIKSTPTNNIVNQYCTSTPYHH